MGDFQSNNISIGIITGQLFLLTIVIVIFYHLVKLYKKLMKYLDQKIKKE
jgi:hypothetical protein